MSLQLRLSTRELFSLTALLLLAFSASIGMPFNIDAIAVSYGVTNTVAGLVASVEMASIAAGNLIFAKQATRFSAQQVFVGGVLLVVSFNVLSIVAPTTVWLMICRAPAGFALGAVVATVMTTAGRSHQPELTFGLINSMVGVMRVFIAFVLPRALELHLFFPDEADWSEVDGLYTVYAFLSMLSLFFITGSPVAKSSGSSSQTERQVGSMIGWFGLIGLGVIFFGHGTLALFMVKIGRGLFLTPQEIGYVFMAGSLLGIGLPLLSGFMGTRISALAPVTIILLIVMLSAIALSTADTPTKFFIFAPLFAVLPVAMMPLVLGCFSRVDPSGTLAGSHAAFVLIGGAIAPFAGGALSDSGGFALSGWFVTGCVFLGAVLVFPVIKRADFLRFR